MANLRPWSSWRRVLLLGLLAWPGLAAQAEAEAAPPGRVGRLVPLQGAVSVLDPDTGQWVDASLNLPLTHGDRVATAAGARAELRIGSTVLRLAGASDVEVQRLDDAGMVFELHSGSLSLALRSHEAAEQISVVTAEASLRVLRSGSYRFDRHDVTTLAASQRGEMVVDSADGWVVGSGQRVELWREARSRQLRQTWAAPTNDEFASWLASAERDDERVALTRHVSPEMTGAEDLDRHGRWDRHPEHGVVWLPHTVAVGWAPYQHGRWAWVRPWGWTWVDTAPWGFAPFHYGRWVSWGGRWCWSPGPFIARPVYAPALVRWVGTPPPHWHGRPRHPGVGWVPLAPRETFVPGHPLPRADPERRRPAPPRPGTAQVFRAAPGATAFAPHGTAPQRHAIAPAEVPAAPTAPPPVQTRGPGPVAPPLQTGAPRPAMTPPPPPAPPSPQPQRQPPPAKAAPAPVAVIQASLPAGAGPAGPAGQAAADVRTRLPEPRGRTTLRQAER